MRSILRLASYVIVVILGIVLYNWLTSLQEEEEPPISYYQDVVLSKIEDLGKIELVKYHFKEITELKKLSKKYFKILQLGPDSKIALISTGEAVGCIDLTKIRREDILIDETDIVITLPKPELCYYKIDLQKSRIYSLETNPLIDEKKFIEEAYRSAEAQIKEAALESGILYETEINAEKILKPIFEEISGKNVFFRYSLDEKIDKM